MTVQYIGESRRISTVETTTTQSQKGNGEVTTVITPVTVNSVVEQMSCSRVRTVLIPFPSVTRTPEPLIECFRRGL